MDREKKVVTLIIHGFTIVHIIAAGVAGPAAGAILTPLTVIMVVCIGLQCKAGFNSQTAIAVMADFVGFILGVSIAEFIVGLIPGIGNIANAIATGVVTELLGWATYLVLKEDLKKGSYNQWSLLKRAWKLRKQAKVLNEKLKETRNKMSTYDKQKYDKLMKIITDKNVTKSEQDLAIFEAEEILKKYGTTL